MVIHSDAIKRAVAAIKLQRPAYSGVLNFYEQLFLAQEDAKRTIIIDPIVIPSDLLSVKKKEQFPLINPSDFVIDLKASELLFLTVCHIAEDSNPLLSGKIKSLFQAIESGKITINSLFPAFLQSTDSLFDQYAVNAGIGKSILTFLVYNSINPSLMICSEQLSTYLDKEMTWENGFCPICGNPPFISVLQNEGERWLYCYFCWHQWSIKRIMCPFCKSTDSNMLFYLYSEEEKEYRIDMCDHCKKYIKTVDTRKLERQFYAPLEHVVTYHLDVKAKEEGYETGINVVNDSNQ